MGNVVEKDIHKSSLIASICFAAGMAGTEIPWKIPSKGIGSVYTKSPKFAILNLIKAESETFAGEVFFMSKKRVVVSLGHKALGHTTLEQLDAVKITPQYR